jgi:hypothetical protein
VFGLGLDQGYWFQPYQGGTEFQVLDDTDYRRLIKARIIANSGDGSWTTATAVMAEFFSGQTATLFYVEDRGRGVTQAPLNWFQLDNEQFGLDIGQWFVDNPELPQVDSMSMGMILGIAGVIPSPVVLAILASNLLPINPAGVHFEILVVSSDIAGGIVPSPSAIGSSAPGDMNGMGNFALGGTAVIIQPSGGGDIVSTPMFGLDIENAYISGLDTGVWGVSPEYLLAL